MDSSRDLHLGQTFDSVRYEELEKALTGKPSAEKQHRNAPRQKKKFLKLGRRFSPQLLKRLVSRTKSMVSCLAPGKRNADMTHAEQGAGNGANNVSAEGEELNETPSLENVTAETTECPSSSVVAHDEQILSGGEEHLSVEGDDTETLDEMPRRFKSRLPSEEDRPLIEPGHVARMRKQLNAHFGASDDQMHHSDELDTFARASSKMRSANYSNAEISRAVSKPKIQDRGHGKSVATIAMAFELHRILSEVDEEIPHFSPTPLAGTSFSRCETLRNGSTSSIEDSVASTAQEENLSVDNTSCSKVRNTSEPQLLQSTDNEEHTGADLSVLNLKGESTDDCEDTMSPKQASASIIYSSDASSSVFTATAYQSQGKEHDKSDIEKNVKEDNVNVRVRVKVTDTFMALQERNDSLVGDHIRTAAQLFCSEKGGSFVSTSAFGRAQTEPDENILEESYKVKKKDIFMALQDENESFAANRSDDAAKLFSPETEESISSESACGGTQTLEPDGIAEEENYKSFWEKLSSIGNSWLVY